MAEIHHTTPEQKDQTIEAVLEGLRRGLPEYKAAENAGIAYPTWWLWRQKMPGLTERAAEAKRSRIPLIEDALYKAALKGSVTACLVILEKEDPGWRQRAKDLTPQQNVLILDGTAAKMFGMMPQEKKQKFLGSLKVAGLLPERVIEIGQSENANGGTNGDGAGHP